MNQYDWMPQPILVRYPQFSRRKTERVKVVARKLARTYPLLLELAAKRDNAQRRERGDALPEGLVFHNKLMYNEAAKTSSLWYHIIHKLTTSAPASSESKHSEPPHPPSRLQCPAPEFLC